MTTQPTERPTAFELAARAAAEEAKSSVMREVLRERAIDFEANGGKISAQNKPAAPRNNGSES